MPEIFLLGHSVDTIQNRKILGVKIIFIQGGPKNQTCLNFGNFAKVNGINTCNVSKVLKFYIKTHNLHSTAFKYFLPYLHKFLPPLKFSYIRL